MYIESFYQVNKLCPLPGLDGYRIRFFIQSMKKRALSYYGRLCMARLTEHIKEEFPEAGRLELWDGKMYAFIKAGGNIIGRLKQSGRLEQIRGASYQYMTGCRNDDNFPYEDYHIYVDYEAVHEELGRQYFNSDAMYSCEII